MIHSASNLYPTSITSNSIANPLPQPSTPPHHHPPCPTPLSPLQLTLRPLLNLRHHRPLQRLRLRRTSPPLLNLAIAPNQEFLEIPLNPLHAQQAGDSSLHPFIHGLGVGPINVGFAENGEGDAVVG